MMHPDLAFYYVKGIFALIGTIGLIRFMGRNWSTFDEHGGFAQRLRFITLFYFAASITYISVDQVNTDPLPPVDMRAGFGIVGAVLLAATVYVSFREVRRRPV